MRLIRILMGIPKRDAQIADCLPQAKGAPLDTGHSGHTEDVLDGGRPKLFVV